MDIFEVVTRKILTWLLHVRGIFDKMSPDESVEHTMESLFNAVTYSTHQVQ